MRIKRMLGDDATANQKITDLCILYITSTDYIY